MGQDKKNKTFFKDPETKQKFFFMIIDKILFGIVIFAITSPLSARIESQFRESEHLRQMLQSVSSVNSDLIVQQRSGLTKSMGEFFKEVSSYAKHADRSKMDFKYLNKLKDTIEISIYQIDGLMPDFSDRKDVKTFIDKLTAYKNFLRAGRIENLHTLSIEDKLKELRTAYKALLNEMRKISTQLALDDYQEIKKIYPDFSVAEFK